MGAVWLLKYLFFSINMSLFFVILWLFLSKQDLKIEDVILELKDGKNFDGIFILGEKRFRIHLGMILLLLVFISINWIIMCGSRKYPYLSCGRLFHLNPPSPLEFPIKLNTFPYELWLLRPSLPLAICSDLPWGEYRSFLEPHNQGLYDSWNSWIFESCFQGLGKLFENSILASTPAWKTPWIWLMMN